MTGRRYTITGVLHVEVYDETADTHAGDYTTRLQRTFDLTGGVLEDYIGALVAQLGDDSDNMATGMAANIHRRQSDALPRRVPNPPIVGYPLATRDDR